MSISSPSMKELAGRAGIPTAEPIGMQDYRPADGVYFTGPASVYPAYPIRMSARDLARFALLYLHDGRWKDRQIVPAQWVHDSVKACSRGRKTQGRATPVGMFRRSRHNRSGQGRRDTSVALKHRGAIQRRLERRQLASACRRLTDGFGARPSTLEQSRQRLQRSKSPREPSEALRKATLRAVRAEQN